ncbi:MAG: DUF2894 domain-containing protein [Aquabacterium sp.]
MSEAQDILLAMRAEGMHRRDPVRFHYLEALAARMQVQPEAVRQVLAGRFAQAVAAYRAQASAAGHDEAPLASEPGTERPSEGATRWAQFLRDITQAAPLAGDADAHMADIGSPSDMKSVRRFARTWSKIATERQLSAALTRGPGHAGPLNSHKLMLRTMSLMHELSPACLQHFMMQADALLWLDQMNQQLVLKSGKAASRKPRPRK